MAASSFSLSSLLTTTLPSHRRHHYHFLSPPPHHHRYLLRNFSALRSSRRAQDGDEFLNNSRKWSQFDFNGYGDEDDEDEDEDEDDDEEEEDRSLDLLVRFVENVFRKVSKRARKAVRSVLPPAISTKLVRFAVNGLIILSFLWVLKAFLEVICTLGSAVFVSILLIRGIWSGVSYLQDSRNRLMNGFEDDQPAWSRGQPVT